MSAPPVPTVQELMACELAARLSDEDELMMVGGASRVALAAALLAQRVHAPNLTVLTGSGAVNPRPPTLGVAVSDFALVGTAEAYFSIEDVFDDTERGRYGVAIFGGVQIDAFGNFNLTFVGGSLEAPDFRAPGLVNAGMPMAMRRFMLCAESHTEQVFVDTISFASGAGTRRPDGTPYPAGRRGGGPSFCVTPLACMDFGDDGRLRLVSRHPGVAVEEVQKNTGFELGDARHVPVTPDPDRGMLEVLREQIDPTGTLRGGDGGEAGRGRDHWVRPGTDKGKGGER